MTFDEVIEKLNEITDLAKELPNTKSPHDDYVDALAIAMSAVNHRKKLPLRDKNSSNTQGHCQCGRIVYEGFVACPLCGWRIDWEAEAVKEGVK